MTKNQKNENKIRTIFTIILKAKARTWRWCGDIFKKKKKGDKKTKHKKSKKKKKICAIMKKFYFTAALSFIILLCLEDAQGQYLSRSNLRQFQRRTRTRLADRNHHQQQLQTSPQQPKSNNDVVVNQVEHFYFFC